MKKTILTYRNGRTIEVPIDDVVPSKYDYGFKIKTKSGKSTIVSVENMLWASGIDIDDRFIVYLMRRPDMGFRVGKTNFWSDSTVPFGRRAVSEKAACLWVLDIVNTNEEAIFLEECYSLEYAIPTAVFSGANRGLNQDRINAIFAKFGKNGQNLLDNKKYSFNNPHWIACTVDRGNITRYVIQIHGNRIGRPACDILFEWKRNDELAKRLTSAGFKVTAGRNNITSRIRLSLPTYKRAYEVACAMRTASNGKIIFINEKLSILKGDTKLQLLPSSQLFVGQRIPIKTNKERGFDYDEIASIEKIQSPIDNLIITDTCCYFDNDILVFYRT